MLAVFEMVVCENAEKVDVLSILLRKRDSLDDLTCSEELSMDDSAILVFDE